MGFPSLPGTTLKGLHGARTHSPPPSIVKMAYGCDRCSFGTFFMAGTLKIRGMQQEVSKIWG